MGESGFSLGRIKNPPAHVRAGVLDAHAFKAMLAAARATMSRTQTGPGVGVYADGTGTYTRAIPQAASGLKTMAVVVGHGEPMPDPPVPPTAEIGRIYSHLAREITGTPPFALTASGTDMVFYSLQGHGWFHPGAVVELFQIGGVWVSKCEQFFGVVSKRAPQGTSVPMGTVEVVPIDGNPGLIYSNPSAIVRYDTSPVRRACTFPGAELFVGEPVLCMYVGAGGVTPENYDADWLAINMPNLFGSPSDGDYANAPPTPDNVCATSDPALPVTAPVDDAFVEDEPVIPTATQE